VTHLNADNIEKIGYYIVLSLPQARASII